MDLARLSVSFDRELISTYLANAEEIRRIAERKFVAGDLVPDGLILVKAAELNPR
jgi:hypothetical protein